MMDGKSASRISFCLLITNMVLAFYQSHPGAVSLIQVKLPSLCFMYFLELFLICSYDSNARFVSSQDVYSSWPNCSTEVKYQPSDQSSLQPQSSVFRSYQLVLINNKTCTNAKSTGTSTNGPIVAAIASLLASP